MKTTLVSFVGLMLVVLLDCSIGLSSAVNWTERERERVCLESV